MSLRKRLTTFPIVLTSTLSLTLGFYYYNCSQKPILAQSSPINKEALDAQYQKKRKDRQELLNDLKQADQLYDLLVIGGGSVGCGIGLDAATRGLKVAVVEKADFASGTSSKSTKLVHGGVRYLEKAVLQLDFKQYALVKEALKERFLFLQNAPYLTYQVPILLPVYNWWKVPYYYVGSKMYDVLAGSHGLQPSYYLSASSASHLFPFLQNKELCGAMVYYDGMQNDSRMNIALALSAISFGATAVNYCSVEELLFDEKGSVCGAYVRDRISNEYFKIKAKGVINATGPYSDTVRNMENPNNPKLIQPSSGVHLVLKNIYTPPNMGLLDASSSDGRVLFFLPWERHLLAGTTDKQGSIVDHPVPEESDIEFILKEMNKYLIPEAQLRREDVLSAWSGIRPLVKQQSSASTENTSRSHSILIGDKKMITVAGGKWTTYRAMAEEAVNAAIHLYDLDPPKPCQTEHLKLIGASSYHPTYAIGLIKSNNLSPDIAFHLTSNYGDQATRLLSGLNSSPKRLSPEHPYLLEEIEFSVREEYAQRIMDFLSRRIRLSFVNSQTAYDLVPLVADHMAQLLSWSETRKKDEIRWAYEELQSMGVKAKTDDS